MAEPGPLWDELAQARHELVRAALRGLAPPRLALSTLDLWPDELLALPDGEATPERMAAAWGNLQLILVECGPEAATGVSTQADTSQAWQRVRRTAGEGFRTLLDRPEWVALRVDLREEVLPLLVDAVPRPRSGRILRCTAAAERLRMLMHRTSGVPQAWRLTRVAEMQYPHVTPEGWVGRMGADITWRRLQMVVQAMVEHLQEAGLADLPLVIGYDSRVHADQLARRMAEIAIAYGQPVHLCWRDAPAPALVDYLVDTLGIANNAGLLYCTAAGRPVKDAGMGRYAGTEYQGLRYLLPYGVLPSPRLADAVGRRAAELLLEEPDLPQVEPPGTVIMFNPREEYVRRLVTEMGYAVPDQAGDEILAREAVQDYWRQPGARILIDEMHGATHGYLAGACAELKLPYEVLHGERNPLLGDLLAANPEPPQLRDLMLRMREVREEHEEPRPIIGLALSAEADRLGVVDETGAFLPHDAVMSLLADYLLGEAYTGEAGMLVRAHTGARSLDVLAQQPNHQEKTLHPQYQDHLPPYMKLPGYQQLAGDPRLLHGGGAFVTGPERTELTALLANGLEKLLARVRKHEAMVTELRDDYYERLHRLLVAGDAGGGMVLHGFSVAPDAIWAALLLLQCCAVRRQPVGALWAALQERIGPSATERLSLDVPLSMGLALVNGYLDRYARAKEHGLSASEFQLGGITPEYVGGARDGFIEWALRDAEGRPAYLAVQAPNAHPAVRVVAHAATAEVAYHLVTAVAERLEGLLVEHLKHAEHPWQVVELLAAIGLPPSRTAEFPATLNCRLAQQAYARLQELARPGREAPELMPFVTERLQEMQPEKGRIIAACHLGEARDTKRTPPTPRVHWEGDL